MIESLHSPHIGRVKALIGSKGAKERREQGLFVAEGVQCAREALASHEGPELKILYATESGLSKISELDLNSIEIVEVSEAVMKAMSDTVSPQGLISLCYKPELEISELKATGSSRFIYLHEIQDPGNAGTIIRSADAFGFDAVLISPNSVDIYSPKVVRSTVGSLWHIPVFQGVSLKEIMNWDCQFIALDASAELPISKVRADRSVVAIFGNEARGLNTAQEISDSKNSILPVKIPMPGNAESLNLSAAASIVMFHLAAL